MMKYRGMPVVCAKEVERLIQLKDIRNKENKASHLVYPI
jgi:hypothetical protein